LVICDIFRFHSNLSIKEYLMTRKVLVTGGAGYIGSILTAYMLDQGYKVVVLDDLSVGKLQLIDKRAKFIKGSILSRESLEEALSGIDLVIHCAAKSLVGESVEKPDLYHQVNIEGTRQLLTVMKELSVLKIIFSSSCAVYGQPKQIPISEHTSCKPVSPYGDTKLACDHLLADKTISGLAAISFRFFNISGSYKTTLGNWINETRDIETHLIPRLIKKLASEEELGTIKVFGDKWPTPDGSCIRDYLHVEDLARAHLLAIKQLKMGEHKIYNLGGGHGSSVFEVINIAQEVTGHSLKSLIAEPRLGDPAVLLADIKKAKTELNWQPQFTLKDIITSSWQGIGST
jgi:UDP-glucose 4-epimerase